MLRNTRNLNHTSSPRRNKQVLLFLSLFLVLLLGKAGAATAATARGEQTTNFGFLKRTAGYTTTHLGLAADGTSVDLSPYLLSWQGRDWFPRATRALRPPVHSLQSFVLTQLGVDNPWQAFGRNEKVLGFAVDRAELHAFLADTIAPGIDTQPVDALLTITDDRATDFRPHQVGKTLDLAGTATAITTALFTNATSTRAVVVERLPAVRLAETNTLGIAELIAHGESNFSGSPKNRIHNIGVGASRFNGVIIKPDEEFSFNRYLGAVTAQAGFKPELVIKTTGTVPELGGGLCQVSTTAFRAALYGGLPITARRNHSYAVKYYAPQGTDATIYPGVQDFKFLNDTGYTVLIQTRIEGTRLVFDFYGTPDGRSVAIDGPYQYDKGPGGAMKARLSRTVAKKNGESTMQEFFSRYVSKDLFPTRYEFPQPAPQPAPAPQPPAPEPPATTTPPPTPVL